MPDQQVGKMRVIIIGGSIAGLFTGIVLSRNPKIESVTILERLAEDQQEDQGAGIRIADEVVDAVRRYTGIAPDEYCLRGVGMKQLSDVGAVAADVRIPAYTTVWRQFFTALLGKFRELPKCSYRWDCAVRDLTDDGKTVRVAFVDRAGKEETAEAELVVGADGISSTVRKILVPEVQRVSAGYCTIRGLTNSDALDRDVFGYQKALGVFCTTKETQFVAYWVPSPSGPCTPDNVNLNWVWYHRFTEREFDEVMTDTSGQTRKYLLPMGRMTGPTADKVKALARKELAGVVAEVVENTEAPFIQLVTDSHCPRNVFMGGKVVLLGDALAGQRPHIASSCTQCTYHALLLAQHLEGAITLDEMSERALAYTRAAVDGGKLLGAHCLDTSMSAKEKATTWQGKFTPIIAQMREPYIKLLEALPAAPAA